jgi:hypothetical protein
MSPIEEEIVYIEFTPFGIWGRHRRRTTKRGVAKQIAIRRKGNSPRGRQDPQKRKREMFQEQGDFNA